MQLKAFTFAYGVCNVLSVCLCVEFIYYFRRYRCRHCLFVLSLIFLQSFWCEDCQRVCDAIEHGYADMTIPLLSLMHILLIAARDVFFSSSSSFSWLAQMKVIDRFAQYFLEAYLMIHGETESYEEFMMEFFFYLSLSICVSAWECAHFVIVVLFCLLFQVIEFPHQ